MSTFPSFEAWTEAEYGGWTEGGKCSGCLREAPRLTAGLQRGQRRVGRGDCESCVRYGYGYDQAQSATAHALIYGAVREALRREIPFALIREAVDQALIDDREEDAEKWPQPTKAEAS